MEPHKLKQIRAEKKMTQEQFGTFIGVSKWTVVAWERGSNPVPGWVVEKLTAPSYKLNPKLTYEQFQAAQAAAAAKGQTLNEWIGELIKSSLLLLVGAAILYIFVA